MSQLPNAEEIYEKHVGINMELGYKITPKENVIEALKEYGRQVRDATLEWAAENANVNSTDQSYITAKFYDRGDSKEYIDSSSNGMLETTYSVSKKSILKGKTSKELEIL